MSLHMCIQNGGISPKSLHNAASDISQGQNWCCIFKKVQYRPKSLHIAASDISQGQNWFCVFKKVQHRLSLCICYIRYITRTKLVFCFQKGAVSPMSLHMCIQNGIISPNIVAYCCI